jgi:hypothetical protein
MTDAKGVMRVRVLNPLHHWASVKLAVLFCALALLSAPSRTESQSTPATPAVKQITGQVTDQTGTVIPGAEIHDAATGALLGVTNASGQLTLTCAAPCIVRIPFPYSGPARPSPIPSPPTAPRSGELESPASTRTLTTRTCTKPPPSPSTASFASSPAQKPSAAPAPSSPTHPLRASACAASAPPPPAAPWSPKTTSPSTTPSPAGSTGKSSPSSPSTPSKSSAAAPATSTAPPPSAASSTSCPSAPPATYFAELKSDYGSENTYDTACSSKAKHGPWGALATGGLLGTDGFILTAPSQRGSIDIPPTSTPRTASVLLDHSKGPCASSCAAPSMNEARNNGTPVQTNGTRLWRFSTGSDWKPTMGFLGGSTLTFRAYGSTQHYRQTFSTIGAPTATPKSQPLRQDSRQRNGRSVLHWSKPLTPDCSSSPAPTPTTSAPATSNPSSNPASSPRSTSTTASARPAPTPSCSGPEGLDRQRLRPHRLVFNFDGQQWLPNVTQSAAHRSASTSSTPASASPASSASTSPLRLRLPRLSAPPRQRALPLHAGRQPAHPAQQQPAQRARHRLGDRRRHGAALGHRSHQLLLDPGQPAPSPLSPSTPILESHPAHAREPRPDREPRRLR